MAEVEQAYWLYLQIAVFGLAAYCLFWRWPNAEGSTFGLLCAVAGGSLISSWMMGVRDPVMNWAFLDFAAASMLYLFRSKRVSLDNPGLERKHALVIFLFAVMGLTHLIYQAGVTFGFAPGQIVYGRIMMGLTYAQLAVVFIAERERSHAALGMGRDLLGRAGAFLLARLDNGSQGRPRGA